MEVTITLKVVLEVPDSEQSALEAFKQGMFHMCKGKLFNLFAVRNVVRMDK